MENELYLSKMLNEKIALSMQLLKTLNELKAEYDELKKKYDSLVKE